MEQYDSFAETYAWLFDDEMLTGEPFVAPYAHVLDRLPSGARVLDCACGIGIEAIALARRGFDVTATDISEGMVAQGRKRAEDAGVDVHFATCAWEELPERVTPGFDLVVCKGNSLVHAGGAAATLTALRAMYQMLEPGGTLIIGTRNFERLRSRRPHIELCPTRVQRDGVTCITLYVWQIPDAWEQPHHADIVFVFDRDGSVTHEVHRVSFTPYRSGELLAWIAEAGFANIRSDRTDEAERYTVSARRPATRP